MMKAPTITAQQARPKSREHIVLFLDNRYKQRIVKNERNYDRKRQKVVDRKDDWY